MRITIVNGFFLPVPAVRGGATEKVWHRLAKLFAAAGHEVTFVSRSYPGQADSEVSEGVRHIRVPGFEHSSRLWLNLLRDLLWGMRVARILPEGDILLCHTLTLPLWISRLRPSRGAVVVFLGRMPKGQERFFGGVSLVCAPSAAVVARLRSPVAAARSRVTGNPVDWCALARSRSGRMGPVRIGFIGRIHPEKGLDLLVDAALELARRPGLSDWKLVLAGPSDVAGGGGPREWVDALRSRAEPLGERLEWRPPEFDEAKLAVLYAGLDVFCYPSLARDGETFGVSVAEAMAAGCAPVVSELACFRELVADGETGLVFTSTDPKPEMALADTLQKLLLQPGLRSSMAARAQAHARRFDFPNVSESLLAHFARVSGERAAR